MNLSRALAAATLAVAATTAAHAQDTTKCAKPAAQAQAPKEEKPNAAVAWGANVLGSLAKGTVDGVTKGLGNDAAKAIKGAAGDAGKYVGGAANEVKKGIDQTGKTVGKAAGQATKDGTTAAAGAVGETFTKCADDKPAPAKTPAPAASAPVTTGEAPAVDHGKANAEALGKAADAVGSTVGGWLKKLPSVTP